MWCEARWLRRCGVALGLLASGCGDDDAPASRDAGADERRDAARPAPTTVTTAQAVAGVCLLKLSTAEATFERCFGFDQYEACARRQCDLELCLDQCTQYIGCLQESPVVCDQSCVPDNACGTCMSEVARCALTSTCVQNFGCAERVEGGYCDQLRSCCAAQAGLLRDECTVLAEATAAIDGERSCLTLLGTVPMLDDGKAVECPIHDAGPPHR